MRFALLRVYGLIALLAMEPSDGGIFARAAQHLIRLGFVLGLGLALTVAAAMWTRSLLDEGAALAAVNRMTKPATAPVPSDDSAPGPIAVALGHPMALSVDPSDDRTSLAVGVGVGEAPPNALRACARESTGVAAGALCLMRLRPAFGEATPERLRGLLVDIEFPVTAYVIGPMVIDAALLRDPKLELTARAHLRVLQHIEAVLGPDLFLPSSPSVVWARRLNGPIQYLTYFLGSVALILITLHWLATVATNGAVRALATVPLPESDPDPSSDPEASEPDAEPAEPVPAQVVVERLVPWAPEFFRHPPINLASSTETSVYHQRVSERIRSASAVLGVAIDPPVLRLRRAAARALANTDDTLMVPTFVETQQDAITALYDARMSLVRYLLWVIPTVGFVGTVLGVSAALAATIGVQSSSDLVTALAQSAVSMSMGLAFDTTLVALVVTIAVMLVYHVVQGAQDAMIVRERTGAEEAIARVSRAVVKAGGAPEIAEQLMALGVNSRRLVQELGFFERAGPQLETVIAALEAHARSLGVNPRQSYRPPSVAGHIVSALFILLVIGFIAGGAHIAALLGLFGPEGRRLAESVLDFIAAHTPL